MRKNETLTWEAAGTYFEACNCLPVCPCRQVGGRGGDRSTFGVCDFALSWSIATGHSGGLILDGRSVVMVGTYDDDEASSPWTVSLFIDALADDDQTAALADIFLGRSGGTPSRNYSPAIRTVAAIRTAHIQLDHRSRHWRIRVDDCVDVVADEAVITHESIACGIPGLDHPGQEVRSSLLRVDANPLSWEWSDRCGFATDFDYRSDE